MQCSLGVKASMKSIAEHIERRHTRSLFSSRKVNPKSATVSVTLNLAAHAWSTKYRRKKKLITQFSCKSRDKSFEPN
jgi:hypothetical protein